MCELVAVCCDKINLSAIFLKSGADDASKLLDRVDIAGVVEQNDEGKSFFCELLAILKSNFSHKRTTKEKKEKSVIPSRTYCPMAGRRRTHVHSSLAH